jgi:hypothetical protein
VRTALLAGLGGLRRLRRTLDVETALIEPERRVPVGHQRHINQQPVAPPIDSNCQIKKARRITRRERSGTRPGCSDRPRLPLVREGNWGGESCRGSAGSRFSGPRGLCTRTAFCPSKGSSIPLDQPAARRARARGLAHSAPCSRTWSSATQNRARGVQSLWGWSAASRASAALPGKGRHSQPPAQYRFVQYGPVSSCRSHLRARGRCCAHRARPAHRAWSDGV